MKKVIPNAWTMPRLGEFIDNVGSVIPRLSPGEWNIKSLREALEEE